MKKILLAAVVLAILFFLTSAPKIFVGTDNQTVAVVDARENLPLTINFIHSVQKTPVIEELEFNGENFILLRTKYKSHGVGLPFMESDGKFFESDGWFIMDDMNRPIKNLSLRIGLGTKIILNGVEYKLYKKFPIGTTINFSSNFDR